MNAKQAARAARKNAEQRTIEQQFEEFNMIPKEDVARIKSLLTKTVRTEDEWTIIKDILADHSLILASPKGKDPRIKVINHILVDEGRLVAFTNMDDTVAYFRDYVQESFPEGVQFQTGTMSFVEIANTADKRKMELYIDPPVTDHVMFLCYSKGRISARMLVKSRDD